MDNYYAIEREAANRAKDYRIQAEATRLGKEKSIEIDSRNLRGYSEYLVRVLTTPRNR